MTFKKEIDLFFGKIWKYPINRDIFRTLVIGIIFFIFTYILGLSDFFSTEVFKDNYIVFGQLLFLGIYFTVAMTIFSYRRYKDYREADYSKRRAESQKEKSKEQLQAVLDGVPDIILQVDPFMRVLWANKAALELSPIAIGNICFDAFLYEKGTFIDSYCKWAMEGGQIEKGIQYQANFMGKKEGSYWEIIGVPLVDKYNLIYGSIAIAREITSRMRIEHTWNLLSSVVESTIDAIYGISLSGAVLSWNTGAETTYGYSFNEMMGNSINPIIQPLDREGFYKIVEKVMRTDKLDRFETTRLTKDKKLIHVSTTICPFVDATGRKVGVSTIERDITESKLAEEKLLESENFNKSIISSVKEGIAVLNAKLKIVTWNKSLVEITGIEGEDALLKRIENIFPDVENYDYTISLKKCLSGKTILLNDTFLKTPAKKEGGWFNISFAPHISTSNDIIGVIITFRDITQSKIAEVALAYSEERYRQVVENVSEAIASIGIDGTILFVNEVAATLVNSNTDILIGKNAFDIVPNFLRNKLKTGIDKLLTNNEKQIFDLSVKLPGGTRSFYISAQPVFSTDGAIMSIMCLLTDITDRKKAEMEIENSREQLRNLAAHLESVREDERKEIAFEIHDELGQELTALKLDLSYLQKKMPTNETILIDKIIEMKNLIDITIDRVGNISTKLRPDILDHFGLLAAIEWATEDFQKRSAIESILIFEPEEINVEGHTGTVVFRILQETLTNIIRHSNATSAEILFIEEQQKYELTVRDNGIGISEDKINDPNSFGLFAMNERARSAGGQLFISGAPQSGTTIRLVIPKITEKK